MSQSTRLAAIVLLGALSAGCLPKRLPGMAEHRDIAVAEGQHGVALAYDDAMIANGYLYPHEVVDVRQERRRHFARWAADELDRLGPVTASNAAEVFGLARTFAVEARRDPPERSEDLSPVVDTLLHARMAEAAVHLWAEVEADASAGRLARAVFVGATIVESLPDDARYAARLRELRAEGAARHLAIARDLGADLVGAKVMHARIAAQLGADLGAQEGVVSPADAAAFAALTEVAWSVDVSDACYELRTQLPDTFGAAPKGASASVPPLEVALHFDTCEVDIRTRTTEESARYSEMVKRKELVPVNKSKEVCGQVSVGTDFVTNDYGYRVEVPSATTVEKCTTEHWVEEELKEWEEEVWKTELYEVRRRTATARASGRALVSWGGGTSEVEFSAEGASDEDQEWTSEHAGRRSFDDNSAEEALVPVVAEIEGAVAKLKERAQDRRGERSLANAQAALDAGRPFEVEHWSFVAGRQSDFAGTEFSAWMNDRYGAGYEMLTAALAEAPLPTKRWPHEREGFPVPPVPAAVAAVEDANNERDLQRWMREMFRFTVGVGGTSLQRDPDAGPPIHGVLMLISGTADTRYTQPLARGGFFRMGLGYDTSGTNYLELDAGLMLGVHVGGFAITPLVGGGLDAMGVALNEAPPAGAFPAGRAMLVEYGARLAYVNDRTKLTADLTYTKAFRSNPAMPIEKRADLRIIHAPVGLTFRYTEYLDQPDAFYMPFTGNATGRMFTVLGGVGF